MSMSLSSNVFSSSMLKTLTSNLQTIAGSLANDSELVNTVISQTSASGSTSLSSLSSLFNGSLTNSLTSIANLWAQKVLKQPPFAPKDVNLFTPGVYPNATPTVPAAPNTKTDAELKNMLSQTFSKRFCGNTSKIKAGLAVFSDPALVAKVPDSRLRASIANLYGTAGEAGIAAIKSGDFNAVRFGDAGTSIAQVQLPPGASKPDIVVSDKYQYEDPRLLSNTMMHEVLHLDPNNSGTEEMIANALDAMVYGGLVNEDPSIANSGTELARRQNAKLLARLNSRDGNGNLRLLTSTGQVYPGSTNTLPNFAAAFTGFADTPGNATLAKYLSKATGQTITSANFDTAAVNLLDQNQKVLSPLELVKLAQNLKLDIHPTTV